MKKVINVTIIIGIVTLLLVIGVKAANSIAASQVTYNGTTVEEELDELVGIANNIPEPITCTPGHYCTTSTECPSGALCSKVSIGDYISMTPTSTEYIIPSGATGYTDDQTINPSELNLWRVIDIREDGTIEMVSEFTSSTAVYFRGQQGYLNLVGTLNLIAKQYENSNYTVGSRHMGYHGQTQVISDTSHFTIPPSSISSTNDNSNETVGGGDIMYTYDTDSEAGLVYTAVGTLKATNPSGTRTAYWLGSRRFVFGSTRYYSGRIVKDKLSVVSQNDILSFNSGWIDNFSSSALRPIITLKSDITSFTGSGTSESPWVLN